MVKGASRVAAKKKKDDQEVLGFLGVGLDNQDDHQRITQCDHFLLVGGSEETHEHMQDVAIKFNEALDKRGQPLRETPVEAALDLLREALEARLR